MVNRQQPIANRQSQIANQESLLLSCQAEISGKTYEVLTTFMQNKANLLDAQMNVSLNITMDYENISDWTLGENKPNKTQSNPISKSHKPIKGAERKKGVRNFFRVSAARKDILLFMGNPILA